MCVRAVILREGVRNIKAIWESPKHSWHDPWVEESGKQGGGYEEAWGVLLNGVKNKPPTFYFCS